MAYNDPGTVAAPTNKVNTTRPTHTRSARSTAPNQHYIVILSGGQHPLRVTRHGPPSPNAAVNNPSSSLPLRPPATRPSRTVTQSTKQSPLVNPPRQDHIHLITKPTRYSEEPAGMPCVRLLILP